MLRAPERHVPQSPGPGLPGPSGSANTSSILPLLGAPHSHPPTLGLSASWDALSRLWLMTASLARVRHRTTEGTSTTPTAQAAWLLPPGTRMLSSWLSHGQGAAFISETPKSGTGPAVSKVSGNSCLMIAQMKE